jgi:hypothetical protein
LFARHRRRRLPLIATTQAAGAAGPPLPSPATDRTGAVAPAGKERLVTKRSGHDTIISAVRASDGRTVRSRRIDGRWSVPAVTVDGATTGLSADGRTLVLVRPVRELPPKATHLAVLDASRLAVERRIALRGFFTVDAISPDGRWVYAIQYAGDNFLDYRVRALDTRTGRFAARDVIDPRKPGERMGGIPLTRLVSPDGGYAYTGGDESFIHALDTAGRTAACIDLDMLSPQADVSDVRLQLSRDGERLFVTDAGRRIATVDARAHRSAPAEARPGSDRTAPPDDGDDFPWLVVAVAGGLGAAAAALAVRLRGRRPADAA